LPRFRRESRREQGEIRNCARQALSEQEAADKIVENMMEVKRKE